MKRTRRDEPVRIIIYICMETTQVFSLCSYLCIKLAKMPCFSFLYFLCFFFYKIGEQEGGTVLPRVGEGLALVGGGKWWGKG
jgi:hypothetical protein